MILTFANDPVLLELSRRLGLCVSSCDFQTIRHRTEPGASVGFWPSDARVNVQVRVAKTRDAGAKACHIGLPLVAALLVRVHRFAR